MTKDCDNPDGNFSSPGCGGTEADGKFKYKSPGGKKIMNLCSDCATQIRKNTTKREKITLERAYNKHELMDLTF